MNSKLPHHNFLVLCVLFVLYVPCVLFADDQTTKTLHQLFDDSWEFDLQESPVFATRFGDHRWDDKLSRESLADQERRLHRSGGNIERLKQERPDHERNDERMNHDADGFTESAFFSLSAGHAHEPLVRRIMPPRALVPVALATCNETRFTD